MYKRSKNRKDWDMLKEKFSNEFQNYDFNAELGNDDILCIQQFMCYNVKDITSSQLRNVYSLILDNSSFTAKRIKIAYIVGRTEKLGMLHFLEKLDVMLEKEIAKDSVKKFTEACVAYHKYYEAEDSIKRKEDSKNRFNNRHSNYNKR